MSIEATLLTGPSNQGNSESAIRAAISDPNPQDNESSCAIKTL